MSQRFWCLEYKGRQLSDIQNLIFWIRDQKYIETKMYNMIFTSYLRFVFGFVIFHDYLILVLVKSFPGMISFTFYLEP